jgi:glycosyltransferase involved in cell wall biosynthesis
MKLSVITVNLNDEHGLEKTVRSFEEQKFDGAELIVIDGGSTDGSRRVMDQYKHVITLALSENDNGIYNAQNKGIQRSKGEYCLFLNAGDYFAGADVLRKVFNSGYIEEILYGDMIIRRRDGSQYDGKMPDNITFHHMITDTLWHPVSFIKKSLFEKYGLYDESLKMVADYDFFLKVLIVHNISRKHLPFPVAVFNLDGFSSDPANRDLQMEERRMVQRRYFPESVIDTAKELNRIRATRLFRLLRYFKFV